ncbi:hypothetical protein ACQJBY_051761 [Aegilops geniculata]
MCISPLGTSVYCKASISRQIGDGHKSFEDKRLLQGVNFKMSPGGSMCILHFLLIVLVQYLSFTLYLVLKLLLQIGLAGQADAYLLLVFDGHIVPLYRGQRFVLVHAY